MKELTGKNANREVVAARESFWAYCQYKNPKFFRDDRPHLKELADTLQALYEGKLINPDTGEPYRKLMINLPPRLGKSYTMTLFEQWVFGRNQDEKILSISYNEMLATRFAKGVRDGIDETKVDNKAHIFADVFPAVKIKYGDAAAQVWALEGRYVSFLAAGFKSALTGFGGSIGIIDDPIKSHIEAANEDELDAQWEWYANTFFSRVEEGGLQIVIMTRWATKDLCGRLLDNQPGEWYVIEKSACLDEETHEMLCPSLLSWKRWEEIKRTTSEEIVDANYRQKPIDLKGALYDHITTYTDLPRDANGGLLFEQIISYTDTADTGSDYFCGLVAGVYEGRLYMLDVIYTQDSMEKTEPAMADMLVGHKAGEATIESNGGGRGFARNLDDQMWRRHRWRGTRVIPKPQRQNKEARIIVNAPYVMNNIMMPADWGHRWPAYYRAMISYQRNGRNKNDDAPDATTGLAELMQTGGRTNYASGRGRRR